MPATDSKISSLDAVIQTCREIYDNPFPRIQAWKELNPGRKAIGAFPVYAPLELAHAGDMLPVLITGGGARLEIDHADSRIQSFVCSISRSTLELGLAGHLNALDGMLFPSICDVARNLSGIWERNFQGKMVDFIHFPQNMTSRWSEEYTYHELDRVRTRLEELASRPIGEEEIRNALVAFNENRALLDTLYSIKNESPWKLSSVEAYLLVHAGNWMRKEDHSAMLRAVVPEIQARDVRPKDRIRVVVEGSFCEQPPLELIETLEEAGCYIVNDDFLLGSRWYEGPIPVDGDPLRALAHAYIHRSRSSSVRHYGLKPRDKALLEKARAAKVDGIVFCDAKFCEPALFDYVLLKQAVEQENIPYIAFEFEEKMGVFESIRTQIETFVESVLFFSDRGTGGKS